MKRFIVAATIGVFALVGYTACVQTDTTNVIDQDSIFNNPNSPNPLPEPTPDPQAPEFLITIEPFNFECPDGVDNPTPNGALAVGCTAVLTATPFAGGVQLSPEEHGACGANGDNNNCWRILSGPGSLTSDPNPFNIRLFAEGAGTTTVEFNLRGRRATYTTRIE